MNKAFSLNFVVLNQKYFVSCCRLLFSVCFIANIFFCLSSSLFVYLFDPMDSLSLINFTLYLNKNLPLISIFKTSKFTYIFIWIEHYFASYCLKHLSLNMAAERCFLKSILLSNISECVISFYIYFYFVCVTLKKP